MGAGPRGKTTKRLTLVQLIPNMLTIAAICAGLSAIRFAVQENFVLAVQLIVVASILDGLDGRMARLLNSDSKMGAELDSLADFLNFGVASPLILYFWALQDMGNLGWLSVLVFTICCVMRLARFNVSSKADIDPASEDEAQTPSGAYFTGVPSPAGALLVLFPMFVVFGFPEVTLPPDLVICAYVMLIGWLMISRIPTWSFKTTRVSRGNVKYFLLAFAFVVAALFYYAWITLAVLCLLYVVMVLWHLAFGRHRGGGAKKGA
ncbi:phosphatidylcholine/phosphatidylserine synthase [Shimia sp.]|uniref:CDP-alcohol phosphatidyltransferase family protein n=1 Tax=Shimia sp. TaxID=1954381 RepID=UPI003562C331